MSKVFLTCDIKSLSIVDGYPTCSDWELMQPMFPMFELDPIQLGALMAATTVFLAICYGGRGLLKLLFSSPTSD